MSNAPLSCTVSRAVLLEALTAAARVVDKRVIPILGTVLLIGEGDGLRWWATDGTLWRSGLVPATHATGSGLVPATHALSVVKSCSASEIQITGGKSFVTVTAGSYTAKLPALPREDFPTVPVLAASARACVMACDVLRAVLLHVTHSILTSSLELAGALFHLDGETLVCVATDRHQLSKISRTMELVDPFDDAVVASRAIQELVRMLTVGERVAFMLTAERHTFRVGEDVLVSLPLHAVFPAFERVIPTIVTTRVAGNRVVLLDALNRVALAADDPQRHVRFAVGDGALTLSAQSPLRGEASEAVPLTSTGPAITFNLNPEYARNFLSGCGDAEIACETKDDRGPVVFRSISSPDDIHVVMPIRL